MRSLSAATRNELAQIGARCLASASSSSIEDRDAHNVIRATFEPFFDGVRAHGNDAPSMTKPRSRRDRQTFETRPRECIVPPDRHATRERRRAERISLALDLAVPVIVNAAHGSMRGLARNISEGGILVQVEEILPLGTSLEVCIAGVDGSIDSPHMLSLRGEVRHHVAWQYSSGREVRTLRGIGIRFIAGDGTRSQPASAWIFSAGHTIH